MIDLYLDFDGVLVDTMKVTYEMMESLGIDVNNSILTSEFYRNLNWEKLLSTTDEINNSFNYIKKLKEQNIYNISILTTVNSLDEAKAKISYIRKKDKDIDIIVVPKGIEKCLVVKSQNSILVDDYSGNLKSWYETGGIPIKFSEKKNNKYYTINSLNDLIEKPFVKKLVKA